MVKLCGSLELTALTVLTITTLRKEQQNKCL
uniref:Uncharacterized protein n=1 Tax=Anguilla anguilla TaxID=7936 RepID=A0A0E9W2E7_ANGAN